MPETVFGECQQPGVQGEVNQLTKEEAKVEFAKTLSKVVYASSDVRDFLKSEALRQFDNNYDVLYLAVKGEKVGSVSFCETLFSFADAVTIEEIEEALPLLNVYLTNTPMVGIVAGDLNTTDPEIPVAVLMEDSTGVRDGVFL